MVCSRPHIVKEWHGSVSYSSFRRRPESRVRAALRRLAGRHHFHKAAAVLVEYGFDCIRISDDWEGADFLAHHKEPGETLMVQLKTGFVIDKKYCHLPDLYMCFPLDNTGKWYLVKHSDLIQLVRERSKHWFDSSRWKKQSMYWSWRANEAMRKALEPYSYSACYPGHGFREARQKVTKALTQGQKDD